MYWGVKPDFMIGHSIGEYVAACISGVFSLRDAIRIVIKRGELMSQVELGSMLSINISCDKLKKLLVDYPLVDLAVVNSLNSAVVSGKHKDIDEFFSYIKSLGYQSKKLYTSHAFHSRMMDKILISFEQEFSSIKINEPVIPYISNVSGDVISYEEIKNASYWSRHLRNCVEFNSGVETILKKGKAIFIEVGPGRTLCNTITDSYSYSNDKHQLINTVRQQNQSINDQRYLIEKLGYLWLNGINIDWDNFYIDETRNKISLPVYALEKA